MKIYIVLFAVLLGSCAPSRYVKPLEKGQNAGGISFGGAVVKVPGVGTLPSPFTTLTYGRGLSEKTTAFGSWHPTAALFGVFQTDIGVTHRLYINEEKNYGISVSPVANIAIDRWEKQFKFWPQLDANFYWTYSEKTIPSDEEHSQERVRKRFLYAGISNWFELASTRAHDVEQPTRWVFNPHIGHTFERDKWNYQLEFKFLAPNVDNASLAVDYVSPFGNKGALGFFFNACYKF